MSRREGYSFWNKNALSYGIKDKDNEIKELKSRIKKLEEKVKELEDIDISPELNIKFGGHYMLKE